MYYIKKLTILVFPESKYEWMNSFIFDGQDIEKYI